MKTKIVINQKGNVSLSGVSYNDFSTLLTKACLHAYHQIAKAQSLPLNDSRYASQLLNHNNFALAIYRNLQEELRAALEKHNKLWSKRCLRKVKRKKS